MVVGERFRVADFRRAAAHIRRREEVVTCMALARELKRSPEYVRKVLDGLPWLRAELGAVAQHHVVYVQYVQALKKIQATGEVPSYTVLAERLNLTVRRVRNFIARHPHILSECDIESLGERYVHGSVEYYKWQVRALVSQGIAVTPTVYTEKYGTHRTALYRAMRKNADIAELFGRPHVYRRK